MIMDMEALLSENQDISQVVGTYVSTNTYDTGAVGTPPAGGSLVADPGRAPGTELLVQITDDVLSAGAATVDFQLIESANADLSAPTVLQATGAIGKADLVAGYQARLAVPAGITQRYLGVQYVIAGATTTAGTVTAGFVLQKQTNPTV